MHVINLLSAIVLGMSVARSTSVWNEIVALPGTGMDVPRSCIEDETGGENKRGAEGDEDGTVRGRRCFSGANEGRARGSWPVDVCISDRVQKSLLSPLLSILLSCPLISSPYRFLGSPILPTHKSHSFRPMPVSPNPPPPPLPLFLYRFPSG